MTRTKLFLTSMISILASCGLENGKPADGLVLDDRTADHVSGTFAKDGVAIDFDLSLAGGAHTATITSHGGPPLIETTLADGIETTTYLGRLTLVGKQGETEPASTGDQGAFAAFTAMPEAQLLPALRAELDGAGIQREMYAAPKPVKGARQGWNATVLYCGQHVAIPTYSWWWSVELVLLNENTNYLGSYHVTDGALNYNNTLSFYEDRFGPWSWWTIYVTNNCWYGPSPIYVDSTLL